MPAAVKTPQSQLIFNGQSWCLLPGQPWGPLRRPVSLSSVKMSGLIHLLLCCSMFKAEKSVTREASIVRSLTTTDKDGRQTEDRKPAQGVGLGTQFSKLHRHHFMDTFLSFLRENSTTRKKVIILLLAFKCMPKMVPISSSPHGLTGSLRYSWRKANTYLGGETQSLPCEIKIRPP